MRSLGIALLACSVSACSLGSKMGSMLNGDKDQSEIGAAAALNPAAATPDDAAVGQIYNDGLSSMKAGNYKTATKKFADVERRYPYSKWATQSLLMQAYSNYQGNSYDDSVNAARRFIELHPGHKDTPYAYYLISLSEYEQIRDVRRDQAQTTKALEALEEVQQRFPDSRYALDAKKKSLVAKDRLAAKEMEVGRYYMKRGAYLAGINRFKKVVTEYQTTSYTPEALYRLTEAYVALGVMSEARTAAAVLGHNYPNSSWYKDAYTLVASDGRAPVASDSSWITKAFKSITG